MLKFLTDAVEKNASDIFIIPGLPLSYKINGKIIPVDDNKLMPADSEALITALYELSNHRRMDKLHTYGDDDLSCSIKGVARFRVSIMKQRGSLAAVIRVVHFEIPRPEHPSGSHPDGKPEKRACPCHRSRRQRKIHHSGMYYR